MLKIKKKIRWSSTSHHRLYIHSDVGKDLRSEDKDLWSKDKDLRSEDKDKERDLRFKDKDM